mmetsp:Transcript_59353/g.171485  ORF Transcript_59353/g.171485 Transcript_59353/m.171485 type:complete len:314 (+) Transcript_59353:112-1053(+)
MYGGPSMLPAQGYGYGAAMYPEMSKPAPMMRRRPTSPVTIAICFFIPFVVFTAVYSMQSFSLHYDSPSTCKALCFAILAVVIGVFGTSVIATFRRRDDSSDPKWYVFLFVTSLIAWVFAFVFGQRNFVSNISPYMDIMNLNVYSGVDPGKYNGQQLMDAGRMVFAPGTHLELPLSMGFKNLDTYCVSPISSPLLENSTTPTYDFWAVGLNCCSGHLPDFHCGEFNNLNARSGLRLMRDDQRAYFRLAVEQAEAAYNIRAPHPIFLYWMQDPNVEVNAYQQDGYKFWLMGVGFFGGFQLLLQFIAVIVFWKSGI